MTYTPEQLKGMNDAQIEIAVHSLLNPDYDPIVHTLIALNYCSDWSATGPLMLSHGVSLRIKSPGEAGLHYATIFPAKRKVFFDDKDRALRSACECLLLQLNQE